MLHLLSGIIHSGVQRMLHILGRFQSAHLMGSSWECVGGIWTFEGVGREALARRDLQAGRWEPQLQAGQLGLSSRASTRPQAGFNLPEVPRALAGFGRAQEQLGKSWAVVAAGS